jgi:hypothetical protein
MAVLALQMSKMLLAGLPPITPSSYTTKKRRSRAARSDQPGL